ncbi:ArsR/SmtB family transcription factor [Umezawaea endophytica]|uniref:Metalloregulator ArsR/SmtB family transcription factor n=1 Tax=Umezawaea endophytica TaxID=1654476 RepID=A0A9X2VZF2_9PSEU|nr:metalloregulator ArsR/SmtB family transcription factor [Umezawaea endophytica]MCS7484583.1 metalloregulator ArsR/SmtB family transcription factor [Umezawaea endophytica]
MNTNGNGRAKVAPTRSAAGDADVSERVDGMAKVFKALSDPIRVRLVTLVRWANDGEACFCGLAREFDMPQASLSHHLRVLVDAGVLSRERRGTWSWYRLRPDVLAPTEEWLRGAGPLTQGVVGGTDLGDFRC